ncbi:MAG: DUF3347 domain-containing protein [Chitinophagales bacterium]
MKKALLLIVICAAAAFTLYKFLSKKEGSGGLPKEAALVVGKNSEQFNASFGNMMNDYYSLKDAFINWDTAKADQAATALQKSADSLPLKDFKGDTTLVETAQNYISSISSELKGLVGESNIEEKRKAFNMLTSEIYDLIRTVRYNGATVYHAKCPMAFGDSAEAYWLSDQRKIINPYLGKYHPSYKDKMLGCGEIVDSLDFSKN